MTTQHADDLRHISLGDWLILHQLLQRSETKSHNNDMSKAVDFVNIRPKKKKEHFSFISLFNKVNCSAQVLSTPSGTVIG